VFRGEWQPPDPAFPGELQIVVSTRAGDRAVFSAMSAAISAEIELAGKSEPDAEVEILMRAESFGPVRAAHDGRFKLLVTVPPNTPVAVAKSKDRLGNVNRKTVDLFVPKVSTLALACPFVAVTAGTAALPFALATAVERAGSVKASAQQGSISVIAPGVFAYRAPERFAAAVDSIEVKSAIGDARCEVPLVPGPAVRVEALLDPAYMVADGASTTKVTLVPRDRFGNKADAVGLALFEGKQAIPLNDAFEAALTSKASVDKRELLIEARVPASAKQPTFTAPLVVHQIPDRGVRLVPVSGAAAVRVVPAEEARLDAVTASDDDGADVPLEAVNGELRVKAGATPKGHVLFTHLQSGQSLLVPAK
jgi:hypothetical protein